MQLIEKCQCQFCTYIFVVIVWYLLEVALLALVAVAVDEANSCLSFLKTFGVDNWLFSLCGSFARKITMLLIPAILRQLKKYASGQRLVLFCPLYLWQSWSTRSTAALVALLSSIISGKLESSSILLLSWCTVEK